MQLVDSSVVFQFVNSQMDETFCFLVAVFDGGRNKQTLEPYILCLYLHIVENIYRYLKESNLKPKPDSLTKILVYFFLLTDMDISSLSDIL